MYYSLGFLAHSQSSSSLIFKTFLLFSLSREALLGRATFSALKSSLFQVDIQWVVPSRHHGAPATRYQERGDEEVSPLPISPLLLADIHRDPPEIYGL